ncbi:hypothetical protein IOD13_08820 [Brevibacterium casei]|nr:hypothetical protein [Brevibacterium casei]
MMRAGFLATSPLVGIIATAASLRWGLGPLVLIGVVTAVFAPSLDGPGSRERAPITGEPRMRDKDRAGDSSMTAGKAETPRTRGSRR